MDQIQSIIEDAETRAAQTRVGADREAEEIRQHAREAAARVIERLDALGGPMSELSARLRAKSDQLASDPHGRS